MKRVFKAITPLALFTLSGCASHPDKIDATYISPLKYEGYSCQQLATEIDYISKRTTDLYTRLRRESNTDSWQVFGGVLLWPILFTLEGGVGPEASEYAQLKGEFEALRTASVKKECGLEDTTSSPEEIIKKRAKEEKN